MKICFFALGLVLIIGCTKSENPPITKNLISDTTTTNKIIPQPEEIIKDIKYKVIVDKGTFNYKLSNGGIGVSTVKYIVVDKMSTQAEVKKLAEKLRLEYQSSDMILIPILTSVTAAKNYDNWDYDNSDSWLVLITKNYAQNTIQYQPAFYELQNK